jgi:hypothetical protein
MNRKFFIIVFSLFFLNSCITTGQRMDVKNNLLRKWVGNNVNDFFLIYGLPVDVIERENGYKIYQWQSDRNEYYYYGAFISVYCTLNIL